MYSHRLPYLTRPFTILIIGTLATLCIGQCIGQARNCDQILQSARDLYQNGKIEQVNESMFVECFKNSDLTTQYQVEAYKHIILSNIYRNQPGQAKEYAKRLLRIDPDYRLDAESEPEEYVLLFRTLRRYPIYSLGINAGANVSYVDAFHNFSVDIDSRTDSYKNFTQVGIQVGAALSYNLTRDLQLLTGINYQNIRFKIENDGDNRLFDYTDLVYDEQLTFLTLPLSIEVDFGNNEKYLYDLKAEKKKIYGFFNLGAEVRYLFNAQANLVRSDSLRSDIEFNNESVKDKREQITFAAFAGAGLKYKIEGGFLKLEARATYGLNNITDSKQRYSSPKFIYQGGYLDNNFRLHAVSLSVGYCRSFYNPK